MPSGLTSWPFSRSVEMTSNSVFHSACTTSTPVSVVGRHQVLVDEHEDALALHHSHRP